MSEKELDKLEDLDKEAYEKSGIPEKNIYLPNNFDIISLCDNDNLGFVSK